MLNFEVHPPPPHLVSYVNAVCSLQVTNEPDRSTVLQGKVCPDIPGEVNVHREVQDEQPWWEHPGVWMPQAWAEGNALSVQLSALFQLCFQCFWLGFPALLVQP